MAMVVKAKRKANYVCQECGRAEPRWLGQCPSCGRWNTLVEELAPEPGPRGGTVAAAPATPMPLAEVTTGPGAARVTTSIVELDRVLGGGLVGGSAVLLGGDPGIGKSTLALQLAAGVGASGGRVLYVSGEEAPVQVKLRADRLGIDPAAVVMLPATDVEAIAGAMKELGPTLAIVDSVQTIYSRRVESAPGSVSQLREASAELITAARALDVAVLLIGHVTKEGYLAGPRVLEHMVDTVLYFEGDTDHAFRILRAVKNRFGPANEIGVFEMRSDGLAEVANPSEVLVAGRTHETPGSVVSAVIEGSRSLLVEVQALVAPSSPGSARRTTLGVDHGRVAMLAAVLERHMGLSLVSQDIFVNTAGGVRIDDPGVDLAVMAALASSLLGEPVPVGTVVLGEVGLTGDVRAAAQTEARLKEAARLGFTRAVIPKAGVARLSEQTSLKIESVASVSEAWEAVRNG